MYWKSFTALRIQFKIWGIISACIEEKKSLLYLLPVQNKRWTMFESKSSLLILIIYQQINLIRKWELEPWYLKDCKRINVKPSPIWYKQDSIICIFCEQLETNFYYFLAMDTKFSVNYFLICIFEFCHSI